MKRNFLYTILTMSAVIIAMTTIIYLSGTDGSSPAPFLYPRSGDSNVSAEYLNAQRTVNYYVKKIDKNPDNPKNYIELAQVFLQEARSGWPYYFHVRNIVLSFMFFPLR